MAELYGMGSKLARIWVKENIMPLGANKVGLFGAAGASEGLTTIEILIVAGGGGGGGADTTNQSGGGGGGGGIGIIVSYISVIAAPARPSKPETRAIAIAARR